MSDNNFVLQIRNYQRIKSAKLEFVPGLNVIQGQSNNGKTAVFRAIQTAVFNLSRESHVTLGETKSAVGIKYNGHEVIWRRDNNAPSPMSYRVDGKILTKLGRGQPKIIAELLGIREVELDDMKIKLNFQKQMEYPFLLDKTPSQLFKFIVQSAEEDNVMDVIQTMKTDLNVIGVNVKAYEEARESLRIAAQREVKRYNDKRVVLPYCDRVLQMETKVKKYHSLSELVSSIKKELSDISESTDLLDSVDRAFSRVKGCTDKVQGSFDRSVSLDRDLSSVQSIVKGGKELEIELNGVESTLSSYEGLDRVESSLILLERKQSLRNNLSQFIESVKFMIESCEGYQSQFDSVSVTQEQVENMLSRVNEALNFYEETSQKVDELESIIDDMILEGQYLGNVEEQMKKVVSEIDKIEKEIGTYDVCPFCGNDLGGEHGRHN